MRHVGPRFRQPGGAVIVGPWPIRELADRALRTKAVRGVRRECRSAFTLVEIMIVVAIVAVVFAMGAPSFVRVLEKRPMRQAVSDIVEGLSQARAHAILQGVTFEFVLNGDGEMRVLAARAPEVGGELIQGLETFGVEAAEGETSTNLFDARLYPDIKVTFLDVNFRDQMEAPEARVRFHPNGTSDDFTMVLEEGTERRKIWLDPITALADMETL